MDTLRFEAICVNVAEVQRLLYQLAVNRAVLERIGADLDRVRRAHPGPVPAHSTARRSPAEGAGLVRLVQGRDGLGRVCCASGPQPGRVGAARYDGPGTATAPCLEGPDPADPARKAPPASGTSRDVGPSATISDELTGRYTPVSASSRTRH